MSNNNNNNSHRGPQVKAIMLASHVGGIEVHPPLHPPLHSPQEVGSYSVSLRTSCLSIPSLAPFSTCSSTSVLSKIALAVSHALALW